MNFNLSLTLFIYIAIFKTSSMPHSLGLNTRNRQGLKNQCFCTPMTLPAELNLTIVPLL